MQKTTQLPEKIINVNPAVKPALAADNENKKEANKVNNLLTTKTAAAEISEPINKQIKILYVVIALLIMILLLTASFIFVYMSKTQKLMVNNSRVNTDPKNIAQDQQRQDKDNINSVNDLAGMQDFIRKYAVKNWQLSENSVLNEIPQQLEKCGYVFDKNLAF